MGVFKHAKQPFGGLGLLLVDVHHLTIRAHDHCWSFLMSSSFLCILS
jgi:hypothetical protein